MVFWAKVRFTPATASINIARQILKRYRGSEPSIEHLPTRRAAAIEKFGDALDGLAVNS